jgi:hypothetical protein
VMVAIKRLERIKTSGSSAVRHAEYFKS